MPSNLNSAYCSFSQLPSPPAFSGGGEWLVIIFSTQPFRDSGSQFWPGHPRCPLGCEEWAGSDHHLPQWAERAETCRQTAGPWTRGRKALLTSKLYACDWSSRNPLLPQLTLQLVPSFLTPNCAAKLSLSRLRTVLLREWIWGVLLGRSFIAHPSSSRASTAYVWAKQYTGCRRDSQPCLSGTGPLQASSIFGTHSLCPLAWIFCSSLGHGEQGKITRGRGRKAPACPSGLAAPATIT